MKIKIILLILTSLQFTLLTKQKKNISQQTEYEGEGILYKNDSVYISESSYIVIFDLHNVLSSLSLFKAIKNGLSLCFGSKNSLKQTFTFFLQLLSQEILKSKKEKHKCGEGMINELIESNNDYSKFKDFFYTVANTQFVNEEIIQVLTKLKKNNHILVLASNIGYETLIHSIKKCPELMYLMSFFDIFVYSYKDTKKPYYVSKPDKRFFEKIKHVIYSLRGKTFCIKALFIDDWQINCDIIKEVIPGIQVLHFKNIEAMKKNFLKKGLIK